MEKKTLSNVIASVAMTYEDLNDYHSAIEYFEKDLALWEHAPAEVSLQIRVPCCRSCGGGRLCELYIRM